MAAAVRKARKSGKPPVAPPLGEIEVAQSAQHGLTPPLPGKMALLPKGSLAKLLVVQPPAKTASLSTASSLSRARARTPGEIIRISLLGSN